MYNILVINLGATSTKIAFYVDEQVLAQETIHHTEEELSTVRTAQDQLEYRKQLIESWLKAQGKTMDNVDAFAVRGGRLKRKTVGGTYTVNETLKAEQMEAFKPDGQLVHAGRMTLPLVYALAAGRDIPVFITDPATIDEFIPEAYVAGHPDFQRTPVFHALNQREVARRMAKEHFHRLYSDCNFVIAHLGGGVSVAAHQRGRVIDANNCTRGEGPFSPTRSGTLPMGQLISRYMKGESEEKLISIIMGKGGVWAYLGTDDMREVERRRAEGDQQANLIFEAMAYQVSKEIGAYVAVLSGDVDAIAITGGIANSQQMTQLIERRVCKFAPVFVYPGEFESEALAAGALRVLRHEEEPKEYE